MGVTRLALSAGSSPASTVMPTPSATVTISSPGVTTGVPTFTWMYCCINGDMALMRLAPMT